MSSALRIALIYPDLLGTYGDRGNALILAHRARAREISAEIVMIGASAPIPEGCDIYLLGGGEDAAQINAAAGLHAAAPGIQRSLSGGAALFAVCAGFQLLGHTYAAADGSSLSGIGLVDMHTTAGETRLMGELLIEPAPETGLPALSGFENHGGRTHLAPSERPFGRVLAGGGNDDGSAEHCDGVLKGGIIGTYMHGPALARNPALADYLIAFATKRTLAHIRDELVTEFRNERIRVASLTGGALRRETQRLSRG
ncbi:MAG: glutamine amidotransferase [Chloroflexota bacterium]